VEAGLEPGRLAVNLSNRQFQDSRQTVPRMVQATLSRSGLELAIDDFRTGFSSLSTIHRFPIHTLKIDRSFINGVDTNPTSQSIVCTTLAEGVERPEELDFLLRCSCPAFQGYLFSRPLPAGEFESLLRARAAVGPAAGGAPAWVHQP
jgi:EAL domain-containing protein (putative c-di-GMP-specific phosphodiesterase class I)